MRLSRLKDHFNRVSKAIAEIKSSDLEKVVLSKEFKFSMEVSNPIEIFKKLSQSYPSAFTYCWFHPQTGFWLEPLPKVC